MSSADSAANAPGEGERVRFCLRCGAVLPFAEVACRACGHEEPVHPDSPGERVVACPACLEFMPASLLFCPSCGVEVASVGRAPPPALPASPQPEAGAVPVVAAALALVAPALALVALAELALDAFPGLLP